VGGDTTTAAVLLRRQTRAAANLYLNRSGITFRSIQAGSPPTSFQAIADPDTTSGAFGDMRGETLSGTAGDEFRRMLRDCENVWESAGLPGLGITAVNAGLFHDSVGNVTNVIGWAGCAETSAGVCASGQLYEGIAAVIDNSFIFRQDPLDQLLAHEFGHTLALDHVSNVTSLMNGTQADNNSDGQVDNIAVTDSEVVTLRKSVGGVPGLLQDPPQEILRGDFIATSRSDSVQESRDLAPYLDISSLKVGFDKETGRIALRLKLLGLLPEETTGVHYWYLLDVDGSGIGAGMDLLEGLGSPTVNFVGADIVARADFRKGQITGEAWRLEGGVTSLHDGFAFEMLTLTMNPHYAGGQKAPGPPAQVNHTVVLTLEGELAQISLGRAFRAQVLAVQEGEQVFDQLDGSQEEGGVELLLEEPSLPYCIPEDEGRSGGTVKIRLEGLVPGSSVRGFLGLRPLFAGVVDESGGGLIDFPIPEDVQPGLHPVTIGNVDAGLTADCVVNVVSE
jgi:hypothetical protein